MTILRSTMGKRWGLVLAGTLLALGAMADGLPEKWFYLSNWLATDDDAEAAIALVNRASAAGYNAVELACGIERCGTWDAPKLARFRRLQRCCADQHIEIIPSMWSMGYGSPLWKDFNFAEGVPCRGIRMKVGLPFADYVPVHPGNLLENGGFETQSSKPNNFPKWAFIDQPGEISFGDETVKHSGTRSLRLEHFTANPYGHGRVCAKLQVEPYHQYRCDAWIKSEGLQPANCFKMLVLAAEGRTVAQDDPEGPQPTADWHKFSMLFNAGESREVNFYLGTWEAKAGKLWIDDVSITELGVVEPLRRTGTPFVVKDAATGQVLNEGVDYEPVEGRRFGARYVTDSIRLRIPAHGSCLREGAEVVVDYYHPARIARGQIPVCMSSPELYDYFESTAKDINALVHPRRWFLDLDEIRAGGTCADCVARKTDMAHILADCVQRQMAAIKSVCPAAEIWAWSDMFDPAHNAHDHYYACQGSYAGAGELIPKDLNLACWYLEKREASLQYFSSRGHKTLAAAYYDADDLKGSRAWLEACRQTPDCVGMMYTTWQRKYQLLEDFGRLWEK